ncbi:unknown [Feldmannia species virus]|uniref:Uncharacterized protein n=1 Tax=Feldmannia species virus TaxID=39420 RepID=B5LWE7_9PHYC|nr:hypothetical protein FeldSpV_gp058 [Feldmannia species virus]ACH46810.1 unknown [Feldmannia species virus]
MATNGCDLNSRFATRPSCFPGFDFQSARSHEARALPGVTRIHPGVDCTLSPMEFLRLFRNRFVPQSIAMVHRAFRHGPTDGLTKSPKKRISFDRFHKPCPGSREREREPHSRRDPELDAPTY